MLAVVGDYSRFTWVLFLPQKSHTLEAFKRLSKKTPNEKKIQITSIKSDREGEFFNESSIFYLVDSLTK